MKLTFKPIGHSVSSLIVELENVMKHISSFGIDIDLHNTMEELKQIDKVHIDKYNEVLDYISRFYGKYLHMKFSYNANLSLDRIENPQMTVSKDVLIMPYRYEPQNKFLFGLIINLDNNDLYCGGIKDDSLNLYDLLKTNGLEIEEITEEEFLKQAEQSNNKCFMHRINKIQNGNYKLTKNGYLYSNEYNLKWKV